jgi:limonene-1,2-epoxide hydrolase
MTEPTQSVASPAVDAELPEFCFDDTPVERTLSQYFATLNAENFQAVADLFAEDGVLRPPFESEVVGHEAIVAYLEKEAQGLQLRPLRKTTEAAESGHVCYQIVGKVQTSLFSVNVGWTFMLNSAAEICSVEVKLLAALQELLRLKK